MKGSAVRLARFRLWRRGFAWAFLLLGLMAGCVSGGGHAPQATALPPLSPTALPMTATTASPLPTATVKIPTPTFSPSPTSVPCQERPEGCPFTVVFVGNIVPGRCVQAAVDERGGDPTYLYREVAPLLRAADLAVGSGLAATLTDAAPPTGCRSTFILTGRPEHARALAWAGLDLIAVATNHIKDCNGPNCNEQAFLDTLRHLHQAGIRTVGGGRNLEEALQPAVVQVRGTRLGFVALSALRPRNFADPNTPGTAPLTPETAREALRRAREAGAQVVVALPHWGPEYEARPTYLQRAYARLLVEAGADLVVGAHAHVVQGMEIVDGVPVFYGLGSFLFDQSWGIETRQSLLLRVYFQGPRLVAWEVIPLEYDGTTFAVRPARGATAEAILARFWQASPHLPPTPTLPGR